MTPEELRKRKERVTRENLIVSETEEGFRVYSPNAPSRVYVVSDDPDGPTCSCPDFEHHAHDPEWRCKHVLAVYDGSGVRTPATAGASAERDSGGGLPGNGGAASMLIKRSVSPDGKIDALSVEFSCPVETGNGEAQMRAEGLLGLQHEIVSRFLNGDGRRIPRPKSQARSTNDGSGITRRPVPAQILDVRSGQTRRGRSLFLRFQVGERVLRRYGSWRQLAGLIAQAGFPEEAQDLEEEVRLDLPCRVALKRTRDGRYLNVERVLAAEEGR